MKTLFIFRFVVYLFLILQTFFIIYLLDLMSDRFYSSKDMRFAYRVGCQIGSTRPLTQLAIDKCDMLANIFRSVLDLPIK